MQLFVAYKYADRDSHTLCGVFESGDLAWAALVEAHGDLESAKMFGEVDAVQLGKSECTGTTFAPAPVGAVAPLVQQVPPTVHRLPLSGSYTPAQAIQAALQDSHRLEHVMCLGEYKEEDGKRAFFLIPSKMDLKIALWIHRRLGFYIDENA